MVRHHEAQMLVRDFMRRSEPEDEGDPEEWSEDSIFDFHSDEGGTSCAVPGEVEKIAPPAIAGSRGTQFRSRVRFDRDYPSTCPASHEPNYGLINGS